MAQYSPCWCALVKHVYLEGMSCNKTSRIHNVLCMALALCQCCYLHHCVVRGGSVQHFRLSVIGVAPLKKKDDIEFAAHPRAPMFDFHVCIRGMCVFAAQTDTQTFQRERERREGERERQTGWLEGMLGYAGVRTLFPLFTKALLSSPFCKPHSGKKQRLKKQCNSP